MEREREREWERHDVETVTKTKVCRLELDAIFAKSGRGLLVLMQGFWLRLEL